MTLSGNDLPVSVDTEEIETLLQAVNDKLMFIDEKMEILILPDEEETETVSDNSVATYEAIQRLEMRMDAQISMQFAGLSVLILAISVLGAFLILKVLPKR